MAKSLFNNGVDRAVDILKSYLFYTRFDIDNTRSQGLYKIYQSFGGDTGALTIRARTGKWAGKSFETLTTTFMGSKVNYPGMPKVDGELDITFDEFQDTLVINVMTAWMNLIFNSNFSDDRTSHDFDIVTNVQGGAVANYKQQYSCDISIYITDSTTQGLVPVYCKFYNCFPLSFSDMELDANTNGNIKPKMQFKYDYFEYKSSANNSLIMSGPQGQNLEN